MPTINCTTSLGPFRSNGAATHYFTAPANTPVVRANRDVVYALGSAWAFRCPCRLSDYTTPIPNIMLYTIEFFLVDLKKNTVLYLDQTSSCIGVTNIVNAEVQVYIPPSIQNGQGIVPGNYFQLLRLTAPDGTQSVQTKGRVLVQLAGVNKTTIPVDDDPFALSQTAFTPEVPASGSAGTSTNEGTTLTFPFNTPSATWTITHNLGKRPTVTTVGSDGTRCYGTEQYIDDNTIVVSFGAPMVGTAYIN